MHGEWEIGSNIIGAYVLYIELFRSFVIYHYVFPTIIPNPSERDDASGFPAAGRLPRRRARVRAAAASGTDPGGWQEVARAALRGVSECHCSSVDGNQSSTGQRFSMGRHTPTATPG